MKPGVDQLGISVDRGEETECVGKTSGYAARLCEEVTRQHTLGAFEVRERDWVSGESCDLLCNRSLHRVRTDAILHHCRDEERHWIRRCLRVHAGHFDVG